MPILKPIQFTSICLTCLLTAWHAEDAPVSVLADKWSTMTHSRPDSAFTSAHQSVLKHDWRTASAYISSSAAYTTEASEGVRVSDYLGKVGDNLKAAAS